ncbi:MAG: hypothetical protein KJ658_02580, partial [Proteobacteria bacterium]|nr:hypothetical protein [Pseudomonadota bacterium]
QFLEHNDFTHITIEEQSGINGFNESLTVSILGLEDLFISYAASFPEGSAIHEALATLNPMDKVNIIEKKNHIHIENNNHQTIAMFSNKGKAKWHDKTQKILHARVLGVIRRQKSDGEDYDGKHENIESWELPIIEILHEKMV